MIFTGTRFGRGVYFAVHAQLSECYTRADSNNYCYMFLARVLTGEYTQGNSSLIVPPTKSHQKLYDSVVDRMTNTTQFVVFYDAQYYLDYLIVFQ